MRRTKVDKLGRIVIPKDIRNSLGIKVGSPLEFFTNKEGEIILVPFEENSKVVENFIDAFKNFDNDDQKAILKDLIEAMKI